MADLDVRGLPAIDGVVRLEVPRGARLPRGNSSVTYAAGQFVRGMGAAKYLVESAAGELSLSEYRRVRGDESGTR